MKRTVKLDPSQYDEFTRPLGMNAEGEIEFYDSVSEIPPLNIQVVRARAEASMDPDELGDLCAYDRWIVPRKGREPFRWVR